MFATLSITALVQWVSDNWQSIAAAILGVIAAASVLIKALEMLVSTIDKFVEILLGVFPGLKGVDGQLKHVAAALDAMSTAIEHFARSGFLNKLALSPAPRPGLNVISSSAALPPGPRAAALAFLVGTALLLAPASARADGWKHSPVGNFFLVTPGQPKPAALAPGLGYGYGYDWMKWSLEGALMGTAKIPIGTLPGYPASDNLLATIYACWKGPGVCGGPALILLSTVGPDLLHNFTLKDCLGIAFSLSGELLAWLTAFGAAPVGG